MCRAVVAVPAGSVPQPALLPPLRPLPPVPLPSEGLPPEQLPHPPRRQSAPGKNKQARFSRITKIVTQPPSLL